MKWSDSQGPSVEVSSPLSTLSCVLTTFLLSTKPSDHFTCNNIIMIFLITHASLIWPFPPFSSYDSINLNKNYSQRLQSYFKISWAGSDQQIFNLGLTINQFSSKGLAFFITHTSCQIATCKQFIAELAEHSPIIIQNSSNPSSWKNLDVRPYNRTTIWLYKMLLLTCVVNCTMGTQTPWLCPVVQWSVHWALHRTTWVLVLAFYAGWLKIYAGHTNYTKRT